MAKQITAIIVLLILIAASFAFPVLVKGHNGYEEPETVFELKGDSTVTLTVGDEYIEPGFEAVDKDGNDCADRVTVDMPEMYNSGEYEIKYSLTDSEGEEKTLARTVVYSLPAQTDEGAKRGLAILMYHHVYDPDKSDMSDNANYVRNDTLEEELKYLESAGYYYPSWNEVRQYIDGKVDLPEKSVVLTFDDGAADFNKLGVPLIEKYDVRATAFIIGTRNTKKWKGKTFSHLSLQSHSYDMHKAGGNIGHGGVFTALSYDEAMEDLEKSKEFLGTSDAFCYPFGDYTDECEKVVEDAGYQVAVTTEYGKVYPGDNPYALKRVRVGGSPSIEAFKGMI